ncbi:MAG: HAD hydrolase family protein [Desulfobacteraceae bacterium]|nr:HAD hydrolase family protein [Desulfobacteraceae bacterium]
MSDKQATFFIDIDGTIIRWSDGTPIESAVKTINEWYDAGHRIVITTMRGDWGDMRWSKEKTFKQLEAIGLKYHDILFDCPSPRIVINDHGVGSIDHPQDAEWDYNIVQGSPPEIVEETT